MNRESPPLPLISQGVLLPSCLILDLVAFTLSLCLISSPETLTGKNKNISLKTEFISKHLMPVFKSYMNSKYLVKQQVRSYTMSQVQLPTHCLFIVYRIHVTNDVNFKNHSFADGAFFETILCDQSIKICSLKKCFMVHTSYLLGFIKYLQPLTIISKFYTQNNNLMLTQETISYCYYDHWHHKKSRTKLCIFMIWVGKSLLF